MEESRKEFIKKAHSAACSEWKTNIESEFPKLFKKNDLVVGNWYTDDLDKGFLVFITKIKGDKYYGFGFNGSGTWSEGGNGSWGSITNDIDRLATNEEVNKSLTKEAKRLGFKEGVNFKLIERSVGMLNSTKITKDYEIVYEASRNRLVLERIGILYTIFNDGVWATIIEDTITKEEAKVITDKIEALKNELLNKKIID
tara:strand:+ start:254 stop:850 length:597 start_codon:yes stop_codon:yes gene_type:complete